MKRKLNSIPKSLHTRAIQKTISNMLHVHTKTHQVSQNRRSGTFLGDENMKTIPRPYGWGCLFLRPVLGVWALEPRNWPCHHHQQKKPKMKPAPADLHCWFEGAKIMKALHWEDIASCPKGFGFEKVNGSETKNKVPPKPYWLKKKSSKTSGPRLGCHLFDPKPNE